MQQLPQFQTQPAFKSWNTEDNLREQIEMLLHFPGSVIYGRAWKSARKNNGAEKFRDRGKIFAAKSETAFFILKSKL